MEQAQPDKDQEQGEVQEWDVVKIEEKWEEISRLLDQMVSVYVLTVVQNFYIEQVFPVILQLVQNVAVEWFVNKKNDFKNDVTG